MRPVRTGTHTDIYMYRGEGGGLRLWGENIPISHPYRGRGYLAPRVQSPPSLENNVIHGGMT